MKPYLLTINHDCYSYRAFHCQDMAEVYRRLRENCRYAPTEQVELLYKGRKMSKTRSRVIRSLALYGF
jgi:hypothetical protein